MFHASGIQPRDVQTKLLIGVLHEPKPLSCVYLHAMTSIDVGSSTYPRCSKVITALRHTHPKPRSQFTACHNTIFQSCSPQEDSTSTRPRRNHLIDYKGPINPAKCSHSLQGEKQQPQKQWSQRTAGSKLHRCGTQITPLSSPSLSFFPALTHTRTHTSYKPRIHTQPHTHTL